MDSVKVIVAGAGSRGAGYSQYALEHPDQMTVVGVAEPRDYFREKMAAEHNIPSDNVFSDWREMAAREKFADAVIIATQDAMHEEPALAFAERKYAILLEKPMAPTAEACEHIVEAVKKNGNLFAVCHVLRYTAYTRKLKELLAQGVVGEIIGIDRVEPVGFWHMAHSFVRGNWRNEQESSFMLLAKSCHDMDWIHHVMSSKCTAVSSFGSLRHFEPGQAPEGAALRCLDCPSLVEKNCPYSALRIYLRGCVERGYTGWPVDVVTPEPTIESVTEALRVEPYGRCVYHCDNNVVDHQVVSMEFEGGKTATFTMMAFTQMEHRSDRIFGTRGEIKGDGSKLSVYDFLTDTTQVYDTELQDSSILGGHGGGDYGLIHAFVQAVAANDQTLLLTGADETLESHLMVFAAEQARLDGKVMNL
ncbi:MAG: Gfo/Idh/MocA family oxidoreductase [Anaerolineae bacterium]|nr:Gfo/Idh/MocA family oxidoreductase [Anaerolineae bacterium]